MTGKTSVAIDKADLSPEHSVSDSDVKDRKASGWPLLDYLGISLLIVLPFWRPGYILTVDLVFAPHLRFGSNNSLPSMQGLWDLLAALNMLLPSQIIEKVILTASFIIIGVGMHRLITVSNVYVRYTGGLLAIFNPFVYDRLMYGQWTVILAYALLPWLMTFLLHVRHPHSYSPLRNASWTSVIWTLIAVLSLPIGLIAALVIAIVILGAIIYYPDKCRYILSYAALVFLGCVLLNIYWLVSILANPGQLVEQVTQFSAGELQAFGTQIDPRWGSLLTVAGGNGFWAEQTGRFLVVRSFVSFWWIEPIVLLGLCAVGCHRLWRDGEKLVVVALVTCLCIATFLAIGIASPVTNAMTAYLFSHSTLYHGLRETQKWIALVIVSEIALAMYGLNDILAFIHQRRTSVLIGVRWLCLIAPIVFTPMLLWGCLGQLQPVEYPTSWFAANERLRADHTRFKVLFLPWHQYLSFPFARRVIANPASSFFDAPIIQGDNMEIAGVFSDSVNSETSQIPATMTTPHVNVSLVAHMLDQYHIKYVLLSLTVDWHRYTYLNRTPHLQLVQRWSDLLLYRNNSQL